MRKKPAQRRTRRAKNADPILKRFKKLVYLLILLSSLVFLIEFTTKYWDGETKLPLVVIEEESVSIIVFDPRAHAITTVTIPGSTEVQVARQLGTWKLGSVGKLGENEGLGGRLVAETLVYHFSFPVFAWASEGGVGFAGGEFTQLSRATFFPYKTNLGLGDKIKMGLFSLSVKDLKRQTIFLEETGLLRQKELVGGERGYVVQGEVSGALAALFAEPIISSSHASVQIVNAGSVSKDERVSKVIEVLGAKVASIVKESEGQFNCKVSGANSILVEKISQVFDCEKFKDDTLGSFAVKVYLGSEFVRRF